jgi:hypothetical protein
LAHQKCVTIVFNKHQFHVHICNSFENRPEKKRAIADSLRVLDDAIDSSRDRFQCISVGISDLPKMLGALSVEPYGDMKSSQGS